MSLMVDRVKYKVAQPDIAEAVEDLKNGKRHAKRKLRHLVDIRRIDKYEYKEIIKRYNKINVRKEPSDIIKKWIKLGIIILLILSLITGAVLYHNHAIDDAYNDGKSKGYNTGHNEGYFEGYHKGYSYYKNIKEEYDFYHKYAVIVTNTGKKYHKYDCYHINNRRFYIYNISNAKSKGYSACLDCFD